MASTSTEVDDSQEKLLAMYIAKYNPQRAGRDDPRLFQSLVASTSAGNWARSHTWSTWRNHYLRNRTRLDQLIAKRQRDTGAHVPKSPKKPVPSGTTRRIVRIPFTSADDEHLVQYLSIENPVVKDRQGNAIYQKLIDNADHLWPWAARHTFQSWRARYVKNSDSFDARISRFRRKEGIHPSDVQTPAQRRAMWTSLAEGNRSESPQRAAHKDKGSMGPRQSNRGDGAREDLAAENVGKSSVSEKAKGKRRALDDPEVDRISKKKRVESTEHRGSGKEANQDTETNSSSRVDNAINPRCTATVAGQNSPQNEENRASNIRVKVEPLSIPPTPVTRPQGHPVDDNGDRESVVVVANTEEITLFDRSNSAELVSHLETTPYAGLGGALDELSPGLFQEGENKSPQYLSTSTPRGGAPTLVSQIIPTPRTLEALQAKQVEVASQIPLVVQEPTPPTSDSPPSPLLKRQVDDDHSPADRVDDVHGPEQVSRRSQKVSDTPVLPESSVSPPSTPTPSRGSRRKCKALVRNRGNDDFFGTPEPESASASSGSPQRLRTRQLPVRVEGAFNSVITDLRGVAAALKKGARRADGGAVDSDDDVSDDNRERGGWPPKRQKIAVNGAQEPVTVDRPVVQKSAQVKVKTEDGELELPKPTHASNTTHHAFSQPTQLQEEPRIVHHPFSQPTQLDNGTGQIGAGPSNVSNEDRQTTHPFEDDSQEVDLLLCPPDLQDRQDQSRGSGSIASDNLEEHVDEHPASGITKQNREPVRESVLRRVRSLAFAIAPTLKEGEHEGAAATMHTAKGKQKAAEPSSSDLLSHRRHTLAGAPRLHLDDSEVHRSRPSSSSILGHASPSASSTSSVRLTYGDVMLDPRDHAETYRTMLKRAVKKTGFPKDIVHQVWRATGSWTIACEVLSAKRVQDHAGQAIVEAIEEHSRQDASASGEWRWPAASREALVHERMKTPPRFVASAPPESPAYVPPDNSRAAIYLRELREQSMQDAMQTGEPRYHESDTEGSDDEDERDNPQIPILKGLKEFNERREGDTDFGKEDIGGSAKNTSLIQS